MYFKGWVTLAYAVVQKTLQVLWQVSHLPFLLWFWLLHSLKLPLKSCYYERDILFLLQNRFFISVFITKQMGEEFAEVISTSLFCGRPWLIQTNRISQSWPPHLVNQISSSGAVGLLWDSVACGCTAGLYDCAWWRIFSMKWKCKREPWTDKFDSVRTYLFILVQDWIMQTPGQARHKVSNSSSLSNHCSLMNRCLCSLGVEI